MRSRFTTAFMLLVPAAAGAQAVLPAKHAARPTTSAITAADLMTRLYLYADDSMAGREAGTAGNVKATDYIAAEARRMGLQPAGDSGSYFQTIPLKARSLDTTSSFTVAGAPLAPFDDYLPLTRQPVANASVEAVFGGMLGDTLHQLTEAQATGKLVVLKTGGFTSLRAMRRAPTIPGAWGLALVGLDSLPPPFLAAMRRPQSFMDDNQANPAAQPPIFLISSAAAAKLFPTPLDSLSLGAAGAGAAIDVKWQVTPAQFPSRNVVAIVPGSDPKLKNQYVAIGAHNDHIGVQRVFDHDSLRIWNHVVRPEGADDFGKQATPAQQAAVDSLLATWRAAHPGSLRPDSISNGADDDGSGTVTVLEIAERIASLPHKPKRSVLFVWHTGEEKGLLGSRYFADHATVPRDSIVAQLNIDMVGRGEAADEVGRTKDGSAIHGSPTYLQLVGSRRLSTELGDIIEQVNTQGHHSLTLDYAIDADGHPSNIYCRSDHYSYARYGIPIVFFTTGLHSDYHQVTDEPQYIDYEHMTRVASLVEDIAVHVADMDHRPVVDKPKPDPTAPCRQ
jgi:hypothetical protein